MESQSSGSVRDIRGIEKDSGDTEKGRGANTVSFPDLRRGRWSSSLRRCSPGFSVRQHPPIQVYSQAEAAFGAAMGQLHYYRGMEQQGHLRFIKDWATLEAHLNAWKADEMSRTLPSVSS